MTYLLLVTDECVKEEECDSAGVAIEAKPSSELSCSDIVFMQFFVIVQVVRSLERNERGR